MSHSNCTFFTFAEDTDSQMCVCFETVVPILALSKAKIGAF